MTSHSDNMSPWYDAMGMALYPCGTSPKKPELLSNREGKNQVNPIKGHSTRYLTSSQNCQGLDSNKKIVE